MNRSQLTILRKHLLEKTEKTTLINWTEVRIKKTHVHQKKTCYITIQIGIKYEFQILPH